MTTLAERFAEAGYDTAAVVAPNPMAGPTFGFDRGFAIYHHFISRNRYALPRWLENNREAGELEFEFAARPVAADVCTLFGWIPPLPFGSADQVVDVVSRILAERRKRPLFLWLHLLDPHVPYRHAHETDLPGSIQRPLATESRDQIPADPYLLAHRSWRRRQARRLSQRDSTRR